MAMEPEARIAPTEGNGEPLENMSGGRDRVHGAGSVGNCPAQGADGKDGDRPTTITLRCACAREG